MKTLLVTISVFVEVLCLLPYHAEAQWVQTNGPYGGAVWALAVSGTNLFAGTDVGLWRRPLSQMVTSVQRSPGELPGSFTLEQNYPNPFNPSTTIEFALPHRDFVKLSVSNIIGQEVAVFVNEERGAGVHRLVWNAGVLPSGIYFYRLETKNFVQTKKMLLVK